MTNASSVTQELNQRNVLYETAFDPVRPEALHTGPRCGVGPRDAYTSRRAAGGINRPNIVVIWDDDVGYWNISAYNVGMMGYKTPNIDRIAKEGALFTDWYGSKAATPDVRPSSPASADSAPAT